MDGCDETSMDRCIEKSTDGDDRAMGKQPSQKHKWRTFMKEWEKEIGM